ncbi:ABC transporter permease [Heliorestis acidaminivorans]|uniref:Cell division protein FtsX n=1 Tax=Heliorestis acidaminivorans TaxID=553427 RepID=A0A6I0EVR8_9FIRM|nr:permease-like cell division protein FtsX [Heliorestis acidaminivorans]KAB2950993.1 ABC transporter permease [Heliorestis acidaminivorans]
MKIRTVAYIFREAFRSMWQNSWMSIASVSTVAVSLLILGLSLVLVMNSNHLADTIESELEIAVFMQTDADAREVQRVGERIGNHDKVSEVIFVPKEEGLANMRRTLGDQSDYFRALGNENPLPDMYRVKASNPNDVAPLASELEGISSVEKVRYGHGVVEQILSLTYWVRMGGIAVMGLIGAAAVFLISTTIRLTVFARQKEITIMKYVGATNWFIRWPFLLEGMFLGFFGSVIAVSFLFFTYTNVITYVQSYIPFVPLRSDTDFLVTISQILLATGVFIGALGSTISLRKFLKV